jgi:hypothetical protein
MKKILLFFIAILYLSGSVYGACNCPNHSGCSHSHNHSSSHSSSSSHDSVHLINTEFQKTEHKFPNCNEHYVITETTTNHYSDGSKRVFATSTIYNEDGTVVETDCRSVEHIIYNDKHYFIIQKNGYKIIDSDGNVITKRKYSKMTKIEPNRILVRYDKKYGIIDLNEKIIVPLKYQSMTLAGDKIFITKLNKYYGIIDIDNDVKIKNNCEKIKQIHDVILLKRYGKYGLADLNGQIIYEMIYDKIKKYEEYILIKKDGKYGVADFEGNSISDLKFDKIRLERNVLQGLYGNNWINIAE